MAAKCQKLQLKGGKWVKANLSWVDASIRLIRFLPTLKLFSSVWHGLLARLFADNETELVAWLEHMSVPSHSVCTTNIRPVPRL